MYCGDETGAFVGDVGSYSSRFGYGGDDAPKCVVPSYVSHRKPCVTPLSYREEVTSALRLAHCADEGQPVVDPTHYLQQGDMVQDWQAWQDLYDYAFDSLHVRHRLKHSQGGGDYRQTSKDESFDNQAPSAHLQAVPGPTEQGAQGIHPLLVVTPGCTHVMDQAGPDIHRKQLTKLMEVAFESLSVPALFCAPSPMLTAFGYGRRTALVVDIGAGGTRVTPVVDGLVLQQSQRRNGRGTDWLANVQWKALVEQKTLLQPLYLSRSTTTTSDKPKGIFHRWAVHDYLLDLRSVATLASTHPTTVSGPLFPIDKQQVQPVASLSATASTYEWPNHALMDLTQDYGPDLGRLWELLFVEDLPFGVEADTALLSQHATLSNASLPQLIKDALASVAHVDTRKDLCANIVITGASVPATLAARLSHALTFYYLPHAYKPKVVMSPHAVERSLTPWIGGSILSSLGSFQQLWASRLEYDEYGPNIAQQRFPV